EAETSEGEKRSDGFWVAGHTQNSSPAERRGARYPAACPPRGGKHVTVVARILDLGSRRRVPGRSTPPRIEIRNPRQPGSLPASVPQSRAARRNPRAQASTRQPSSAQTMAR